jgi:hypothetical protein
MLMGRLNFPPAESEIFFQPRRLPPLINPDQRAERANLPKIMVPISYHQSQECQHKVTICLYISEIVKQQKAGCSVGIYESIGWSSLKPCKAIRKTSTISHHLIYIHYALRIDTVKSTNYK